MTFPKASQEKIPATLYTKSSEHFVAAEELRGRVPISVVSRKGRYFVQWADFSAIGYRDPFFFQTYSRFKAQGRYEILETDINVLESLAALHPVPGPRGLVFHVSHCGSTVISNVLGAIQRNISWSEPESLNTLAMARGISAETRTNWLQGLVNAFCQPLGGREENFFFKLNSWSLVFADRILRALSGIPMLLIYRHPVEVMAGQFARPRLNTYWLADSEISGLDRRTRLSHSLAEVVARSLAHYYQAMIEIVKQYSDVMVLNYEDFSPDSFARMLRHFNVEVTGTEFEKMCDSVKIYSKDPSKATVFQDDSVTKRRQSLPLVHEMAEKWCLEPYEELRAVASQA